MGRFQNDKRVSALERGVVVLVPNGFMPPEEFGTSVVPVETHPLGKVDWPPTGSGAPLVVTLLCVLVLLVVVVVVVCVLLLVLVVVVLLPAGEVPLRPAGDRRRPRRPVPVWTETIIDANV